MALIVNKAGYPLNVKNENGVSCFIPFDNRVHEVSDWTYLKYRELFILTQPMKRHIPVITPVIVEQPIILPTIPILPELKIEVEISKPLANIKIKKTKRAKLTKRCPNRCPKKYKKYPPISITQPEIITNVN